METYVCVSLYTFALMLKIKSYIFIDSDLQYIDYLG